MLRGAAHVVNHLLHTTDGEQPLGVQSLALTSENATLRAYEVSIQISFDLGSSFYRPLFHTQDTDVTKFKALQYALFTTSFVEILGGVFFLITAAYILKDKAKVEEAIAGKNKKINPSQSYHFASHKKHNYFP